MAPASTRLTRRIADWGDGGADGDPNGEEGRERWRARAAVLEMASDSERPGPKLPRRVTWGGKVGALCSFASLNKNKFVEINIEEIQ